MKCGTWHRTFLLLALAGLAATLGCTETTTPVSTDNSSVSSGESTDVADPISEPLANNPLAETASTTQSSNDSSEPASTSPPSDSASDPAPESTPTAQGPAADSTPVSTTSSGNSEQWLRWGGPDVRMVAPDTGWSSGWQTQSPREIWRAEIGTGFSSFSVKDGRVFTMGRDGDQDLIVALSLSDGSQIWTQRLTVPLFDNLHEGGPGATPTLFGDKVITVSRDGQVLCMMQETGEIVWSANLSELTGIQPPEWGFTTSAWAGDWSGTGSDVALFEVGSLVALNTSDGSLRWKTDPATPGYGSPVVFERQGESLVATVNNDVLQICRLESGEVVASAPWESRFETAAVTPLFVGDECFLSSGYGAGCALYRFDGSQLEQVYANRAMSNHMNACVLIDNTLYGVDGNSDRSRLCRLVAMDWATGEELWAERGYGCGSVLGCGNRILVLSDEGVLAVVAAEREAYRELGRLQILEGRCWTVPVLVGQVLLARDAAGTVVALELPQ